MLFPVEIDYGIWSILLIGIYSKLVRAVWLMPQFPTAYAMPVRVLLGVLDSTEV